MAGIVELFQQIIDLTKNVGSLQSDFAKLEKDHEKLLEKYMELSVRLERLGAAAEVAAIKEAGLVARETGTSIQGAVMSEIVQLHTRVQHLERGDGQVIDNHRFASSKKSMGEIQDHLGDNEDKSSLK